MGKIKFTVEQQQALKQAGMLGGNLGLLSPKLQTRRSSDRDLLRPRTNLTWREQWRRDPALQKRFPTAESYSQHMARTELPKRRAEEEKQLGALNTPQSTAGIGGGIKGSTDGVAKINFEYDDAGNPVLSNPVPSNPVLASTGPINIQNIIGGGQGRDDPKKKDGGSDGGGNDDVDSLMKTPMEFVKGALPGMNLLPFASVPFALIPDAHAQYSQEKRYDHWDKKGREQYKNIWEESEADPYHGSFFRNAQRTMTTGTNAMIENSAQKEEQQRLAGGQLVAGGSARAMAAAAPGFYHQTGQNLSRAYDIRNQSADFRENYSTKHEEIDRDNWWKDYEAGNLAEQTTGFWNAARNVGEKLMPAMTEAFDFSSKLFDLDVTKAMAEKALGTWQSKEGINPQISNVSEVAEASKSEYLNKLNRDAIAEASQFQPSAVPPELGTGGISSPMPMPGFGPSIGSAGTPSPGSPPWRNAGESRYPINPANLMPNDPLGITPTPDINTIRNRKRKALGFGGQGMLTSFGNNYGA